MRGTRGPRSAPSIGGDANRGAPRRPAVRRARRGDGELPGLPEVDDDELAGRLDRGKDPDCRPGADVGRGGPGQPTVVRPAHGEHVAVRRVRVHEVAAPVERRRRRVVACDPVLVERDVLGTTRSSSATRALPHVSPPSDERLIASRVTPSSRASVEISHVPCAASYATTGSLARVWTPGGALAVVSPGRRPFRHEAPSSVVTANPMFVAPPLKRRPTWKVATVVRPNVKLSGSASVSCCASARRVRIAGKSSADELAVGGDRVGQIGIHDVDARSAAHDVARGVV